MLMLQEEAKNESLRDDQRIDLSCCPTSLKLMEEGPLRGWSPFPLPAWMPYKYVYVWGIESEVHAVELVAEFVEEEINIKREDDENRLT